MAIKEMKKLNYYNDIATPERLKWWAGLPEREQDMRIALFRLEKLAIPERKSLLRLVDAPPEHGNSRQNVIKNDIRLLKIAAKAIRRQIPVCGYAKKVNGGATEWLRGHCQQEMPFYAEYCPLCGQKVAVDPRRD